MKQLKNFLIKREQSQACLSFAKREKSRLLAKTILTLVALLAVTAGAWADGTPLLTIESIDNPSFTSGSKTFDDKVTVTYSSSVYYSSSYGWYGIGSIASLLTVAGTNGYTITSCKFYTVAGIAETGYTVEGESPSVYLAGAGVYIDDSKSLKIGEPGLTKIEVYVDAAAASGPEVAWDKTSKTGTFTMPGGNVELEPEYYPQAALTAKPTAINDVPATTDGAIVNAGTVATIGETETAQGTVMYYAVQSATAPTAPDYDATGWTDKVPTATDFAEGNVYVWYYVKGADGDETSTFNDGAITKLGESGYITLLAAPTYAVTFAEGVNPEPPAEPEWTASPNADVTKGETVTVTYSGSKKVLGVKAEKKSAGPLAAAFKDGAKFKVGYQWNGGLTTYLEFTNSGGTYSLTSVSGANEANGFNSSTLTVKDGNVLALDVVCHPEGGPKMDEFSAQIEFDATSSTYKYSSKGSYFDGIISVTVNDADITSQLTPAN